MAPQPQVRVACAVQRRFRRMFTIIENINLCTNSLCCNNKWVLRHISSPVDLPIMVAPDQLHCRHYRGAKTQKGKRRSGSSLPSHSRTQNHRTQIAHRHTGEHHSRHPRAAAAPAPASDNWARSPMCESPESSSGLNSPCPAAPPGRAATRRSATATRARGLSPDRRGKGRSSISPLISSSSFPIFCSRLTNFSRVSLENLNQLVPCLAQSRKEILCFDLLRVVLGENGDGGNLGGLRGELEGRM
ncbi:serine/threonine-protein kinase PRP4 homolog [Striga asiatica]|uniref:Serine/threonine-protein kinase PRP4 homolog n=1 Tax=Striga asiatica TaxID=4170 RepID=A0A5A7P1X0_STRAF|nr:serine/threonine-protein kinase PRP4 homolog [Striga asiatica]